MTNSRTPSGLVAATGQGLSTSLFSVFGRAVVWALRAARRTFASTSAVWWPWLPGQWHWPPRDETDGGER
jgi:hypothetical protein